jgi:glycosyltransferase involved in cell wall biosynthesis
VRIVHLIIGGDVAGGQIVALQLAGAGRGAGHDVSFVSPSDGPFLDLVRAEGFAAHVLPVRGGLVVAAVTRLTRLLRREGADLLHTHGHFAVNVVGRIAARLAGAAVLSHMHVEAAFRAGRGRGLQVALDNATARLCFAIVAVSNATREGLVRQGYPARKLVTVHNGIAVAEPAEPVRLVEAPQVLEVARLADVKGQRTLLAALAQLDATAVLVGVDLEQGGAYEQELRAHADRLGVSERVVFAGYRADVAALMAGSDVFCLPSTIEGLPIVVLEAMAQGTPVVASAVGGTPELVEDGVTGLLVAPGDVDGLARALAQVLDDPKLARLLGEAGRRRVREEFSATEAAERILRLYESASTMRA